MSQGIFLRYIEVVGAQEEIRTLMLLASGLKPDVSTVPPLGREKV